MDNKPSAVLEMFRFYVRLAKLAVTEFYGVTDRILAAVAVVAFLGTLVNDKIMAVLQSRLQAQSKWWSVIPIASFFLYRLLRANYEHFKSEKDSRLEAEKTCTNVENELQTLREELRKRKPSLVLDIGRVCVVPPQPGSMFVGRQPIAVALLEVLVTNHGSPSIGKGWGCRVNLIDGRNEQGSIFMHTGTISLRDDDGTLRLAIGKNDFIQELVAKKPIAEGGGEIGWLGAAFFELSNEELVDPKTSWYIFCQDVTGARAEVTHHMKGVPERHVGYTPGGVAPPPS